MKHILNKITALFLAILMVLPVQGFAQVLSYMPPPGQMITQSIKPYDLPYIVGMRFNGTGGSRTAPTVDIFNFTFFLNRGNAPAKEDILRSEVDKVGKYFLAALTIPEKDLWVNLSPYEQNRIITPELSRTDLGKDLLGEDYVLKQLAASLTYPDSESGREYWQEINNVGARSPRPGQGNPAPTNSFTKIWIVPGTIKMKEASDRVVITQATLKVMTEEDYLATQQNNIGAHASPVITGGACPSPTESFKKYIVPIIEKEVNTGKHFAHLRQVYRAIILAGWFKKKLKDTILSQVYFDQKKTKGAENNDPALKEKIYNEYVKAFNQGVYKVIQREKVKSQNFSGGYKIERRQYFSGGANLGATSAVAQVTPATIGEVDRGDAAAGMEARVRMESADGALVRQNTDADLLGNLVPAGNQAKAQAISQEQRKSIIIEVDRLLSGLSAVSHSREDSTICAQWVSGLANLREKLEEFGWAFVLSPAQLSRLFDYYLGMSGDEMGDIDARWKIAEVLADSLRRDKTLALTPHQAEALEDKIAHEFTDHIPNEYLLDRDILDAAESNTQPTINNGPEVFARVVNHNVDILSRGKLQSAIFGAVVFGKGVHDDSKHYSKYDYADAANWYIRPLPERDYVEVNGYVDNNGRIMALGTQAEVSARQDHFDEVIEKNKLKSLSIKCKVSPRAKGERFILGDFNGSPRCKEAIEQALARRNGVTFEQDKERFMDELQKLPIPIYHYLGGDSAQGLSSMMLTDLDGFDLSSERFSFLVDYVLNIWDGWNNIAHARRAVAGVLATAMAQEPQLRLSPKQREKLKSLVQTLESESQIKNKQFLTNTVDYRIAQYKSILDVDQHNRDNADTVPIVLGAVVQESRRFIEAQEKIEELIVRSLKHEYGYGTMLSEHDLNDYTLAAMYGLSQREIFYLYKHYRKVQVDIDEFLVEAQRATTPDKKIVEKAQMRLRALKEVLRVLQILPITARDLEVWASAVMIMAKGNRSGAFYVISRFLDLRGDGDVEQVRAYSDFIFDDFAQLNGKHTTFQIASHIFQKTLWLKNLLADWQEYRGYILVNESNSGVRDKIKPVPGNIKFPDKLNMELIKAIYHAHNSGKRLDWDYLDEEGGFYHIESGVHVPDDQMQAVQGKVAYIEEAAKKNGMPDDASALAFAQWMADRLHAGQSGMAFVMKPEGKIKAAKYMIDQAVQEAISKTAGIKEDDIDPIALQDEFFETAFEVHRQELTQSERFRLFKICQADLDIIDQVISSPAKSRLLNEESTKALTIEAFTLARAMTRLSGEDILSRQDKYKYEAQAAYRLVKCLRLGQREQVLRLVAEQFKSQNGDDDQKAQGNAALIVNDAQEALTSKASDEEIVELMLQKIKWLIELRQDWQKNSKKILISKSKNGRGRRDSIVDSTGFPDYLSDELVEAAWNAHNYGDGIGWEYLAENGGFYYIKEGEKVPSKQMRNARQKVNYIRYIAHTKCAMTQRVASQLGQWMADRLHAGKIKYPGSLSQKNLLKRLEFKNQKKLEEAIDEAVSRNKIDQVNAFYDAMGGVDLYTLWHTDLLAFKNKLRHCRDIHDVIEPSIYVDPLTNERVVKVFCRLDPINPRAFEILSVIKEAARADRVDLAFVTTMSLEQSQAYWESAPVQEALAKNLTRVQVVDSYRELPRPLDVIYLGSKTQERNIESSIVAENVKRAKIDIDHLIAGGGKEFFMPDLGAILRDMPRRERFLLFKQYQQQRQDLDTAEKFMENGPETTENMRKILEYFEMQHLIDVVMKTLPDVSFDLDRRTGLMVDEAVRFLRAGDYVRLADCVDVFFSVDAFDRHDQLCRDINLVIARAKNMISQGVDCRDVALFVFKKVRWLVDLRQDWQENRGMILARESGRGVRDQVMAAPEGIRFPVTLSDALVEEIWAIHAAGTSLDWRYLEEDEGFYHIINGVRVPNAEMKGVVQKRDYLVEAAKTIGAMDGASALAFAQWMCDRLHAGEAGTTSEIPELVKLRDALKQANNAPDAAGKLRLIRQAVAALRALGTQNPEYSKSLVEVAIAASKNGDEGTFLQLSSEAVGTKAYAALSAYDKPRPTVTMALQIVDRAIAQGDQPAVKDALAKALAAIEKMGASYQKDQAFWEAVDYAAYYAFTLVGDDHSGFIAWLGKNGGDAFCNDVLPRIDDLFRRKKIEGDWANFTKADFAADAWNKILNRMGIHPKYRKAFKARLLAARAKFPNARSPEFQRILSAIIDSHHNMPGRIKESSGQGLDGWYGPQDFDGSEEERKDKLKPIVELAEKMAAEQYPQEEHAREELKNLIIDAGRWAGFRGHMGKTDNDLTGANGGFDFAKTSQTSQVEAIGGGLKTSQQKTVSALSHGEVTGFKLAILSLSY